MENNQTEKTNGDGLKLYRIPCEPFDLYGIRFEEETDRFVRMPSETAKEVSGNVNWLNTNTAGGRIRFSTDSDVVSVQVTYKALTNEPHGSLLGLSGFVLLEEREDKTVFVYSFMPHYYCNDKEEMTDHGYSVTKHIPGGTVRNYILYFPNYNDVESFRIGLNENAFVGHGKAYKDIKPILYYGSSITQGGCASRADNAYQALISKWSNIDFINLGFSGSCIAEDRMVDYLASVDCSVFVCDYDYNAPNPEFLEKTHYRLYRRYREKRPDTPIVFISNPDTDENFLQAKERFAVIKNTYDTAAANGDRRVYLLDGAGLYDEDDRENCTVDGTHPNDLGFYRMAKNICRFLIDHSLIDQD